MSDSGTVKTSLSVVTVFLLKAVILLALVVCSAEVAGLIYSIGFYGIGYSDAGEEKVEMIQRLAVIQPERPKDNPIVYINNIARELHPYFGFTLKRDGSGVNNNGFPAETDYPYVSTQDEFVVGLFGGSVAIGQARTQISRRFLEGSLKKMLAGNGFNKVTVLCFSSGGWRQPQTFYSFVYFLNTIDMAIVLDGFNDVAFMNENTAMEWPTRYPWKELYDMLANPEVSYEELFVIGEITVLSRSIEKWTRLFSLIPMNKSLFAHSVWRLASNRLYSVIQKKHEDISRKSTSNLDYISMAADSPEEGRRHIEDYFKFYENLSLWQATIAKEQNLPYFHFIQPNQYVRDSKPFSRTEKKMFVSKGEQQFERITAKYRRLEEIIDELRLKGVEAHSLVNIFEDTESTVYRDDCCHFNDQGKEAIAKKMIEIIGQKFSAGLQGRKIFRGSPVMKHAVR